MAHIISHAKSMIYWISHVRLMAQKISPIQLRIGHRESHAKVDGCHTEHHMLNWQWHIGHHMLIC